MRGFGAEVQRVDEVLARLRRPALRPSSKHLANQDAAQSPPPEPDIGSEFPRTMRSGARYAVACQTCMTGAKQTCVPQQTLARRTPGAVADVEAVDGLHQAANGFLKEVAVGQTVVAEPLGDVGGEADVGGREAVLVMDVLVVEAADGRDEPLAVVLTLLADELGHRPRFKRRTVGPQLREVPDEDPDQLAFDVPEVGE